MASAAPWSERRGQRPTFVSSWTKHKFLSLSSQLGSRSLNLSVSAQSCLSAPSLPLSRLWDSDIEAKVVQLKMSAAGLFWLIKGKPFVSVRHKSHANLPADMKFISEINSCLTLISDIDVMTIFQQTPSLCLQWWRWCWNGVNISLVSAQKLR